MNIAQNGGVVALKCSLIMFLEHDELLVFETRSLRCLQFA